MCRFCPFRRVRQVILERRQEFKMSNCAPCSAVRPCTRCVKRNIGHLCHDEPRDPKKQKSETSNAPENGHEDRNMSPQVKASATSPVNGVSSNAEEQQQGKPSAAGSSVSLPPPPIPVSKSGGGPSGVAPVAVSVAPRSSNPNSHSCMS
jgi:hypothetical protein